MWRIYGVGYQTALQEFKFLSELLTVVLNIDKITAYDDYMPEATKRYQSNL